MDSWETRPVPSVVRATVASWITTNTPSAVTLRSNSTMAACQRETANPKAASVFSGARAAPPRCAMRSGAPARKGAPGRRPRRNIDLTSGARGSLHPPDLIGIEAVKAKEHKV